jgi:hypothetical protein
MVKQKWHCRFNSHQLSQTISIMTDANTGRGVFGRSGMLRRAAGQRFGVIDAERRQPSTVMNGASSIANNELSTSAEDGVENPEVFTRNAPQIPQKVNNQLYQIDENECAMPNVGPQTFEFDANASLRLSDYSFNTPSSFVPYTADDVEEYLLDSRSQYTSETLGSFTSVAVNSYSALIKDFAGESSSTTHSESSATTDTVEHSNTPVRRNGDSPRSLVATDRLSTLTTPSYRDFRAFVYGNDKEEEVLSQLVSSLQNTNTQQENTIQQLLIHITKLETRLQSQDEFKKAESNEDNPRPMMDPPARDDDNEDPPQSLKDYDDLVEEIGRLTYENEQLLSKCKRLEEDDNHHRERILALENDLRGENNDIRRWQTH